jgi:hypothetical protein
MFKEHLPAKFLCKFQPCRNIAANGINPPLKGFAVVGARHAASSAWVRLPPKPPPSIRYHYAQKPPPTLKPPSDHSCQSADLAHAKWLALLPMPNGWQCVNVPRFPPLRLFRPPSTEFAADAQPRQASDNP